MSLLPEINRQKTKEKVDNLLSNYHRLKRFAGRPIEIDITSTLSTEPKGSSYDNSSKQEKAVLRKLNAGNCVDDIHIALTRISNDSRYWLTLKYINSHKKYDYEIYSEQLISETSYYRYLGQAQIEFAEAYRDGELLVEYD